MNCIIVDDDTPSRFAIKQLISKVGCLKLKEEYSNSTEAFDYIKKGNIDLVFLDVLMSGMNGIELINNLAKRPIIIMISAKKDHAVEAFDHNIADYIIKPINPHRFSMAVTRAKEMFDVKDKQKDIDEKNKEYIFVRCNSILTKIKLNEIIYIQASGDHVNICTDKKSCSVHSILTSIEEKLPPNKFYRVDSSYLISMDYLDKVEGNSVSGRHPLPLGENYKKELLRKLPAYKSH
jgi:DNA-binding LytR/AlgR family response regulator